MGIFEHFPYSNFHDLNLDRVMERTNEAATNSATALTAAQSAATDATSALNKANSAINTANSASTAAGNAVNTANAASTAAGNAVNTANTASTAAGNAVNTANSALSIANSAQITYIKVNCTTGNPHGTAVMDTTLTFDEVRDLVVNNKARFIMEDNGDVCPAYAVQPRIRIMDSVNAEIIISAAIPIQGLTEYTSVAFRIAKFTTSLTGNYYKSSVALTPIYV